MDISFISKIDNARLPHTQPDTTILAIHDGNIVAMCSLDGVTLHPKRVLNT